MNKYIICFTTINNRKKAKFIARELIKGKLAACINIIDIDSIYKWEGKIITEEEFLLMIKTKKYKFKSLKEKILELHPYQLPELIAFEIKNGYKKYLNWIDSIVC
jgi:periplasmic divalent cation tolerance protein